MDRFKLRFTNVDCASEGRTFSSLNEAVAAGKATGFEFSVWDGDRMAASWTVFGGLR